MNAPVDRGAGPSPTETARARLRRGPEIPPAVLGTIAVAWALVLVAQATGRSQLLGHDELIGGGLPLWAALCVHLLAWQVMIPAMMLPSSLPMIRVFATVSRDDARPRADLAGYLAGYAAVWSVFGILAFLGDALVHETVEATPWLETRPGLIGGSVLALAGAFQFSSLKDRCLKRCRRPAGFLLPRHQQGAAAAFLLGRRHGLVCLGCCWAIMLVGFAAGMANLWWMAALTGLMAFEQTGRGGNRAVAIGVALLALAAVLGANPAWESTLLGS